MTEEKKYRVPINPTYSEDIRKLQDSDPASASAVFNPLFERIIENIHYLKLYEDGMVTELEITIPAAGWTEEPLGEYCCTRDVPIEGVTAQMIPHVTVLPAGESMALTCGLCPSVETLDGAVRLHAMAAPSKDIPARLTILRYGVGNVMAGGGGVAGIPVATAETVGAVKPGRGLLVASDGTLSVDTATDEEFQTLLNEGGE